MAEEEVQGGNVTKRSNITPEGTVKVIYATSNISGIDTELLITESFFANIRLTSPYFMPFYGGEEQRY